MGRTTRILNRKKTTQEQSLVYIDFVVGSEKVKM
jgi:hypothetical protein